MALADCVAVKSFTGIATNPKDTVNEPMERAAMRHTPKPPDTGLTLMIDTNAKSLRKALFSLKDIMPSVAVLCHPGRHIVDCEVRRLRRLELLPRERHRDRRAGYPAWRIRDIQRLAPHVHVVVDEDLAGSLLDRPVHGDVFRVCAHQMASHGLADVTRFIESNRALDRHEDVQSGLA